MHAIVYLVLTWTRFFTLKMFTCSPQEKIIVEFIKNNPDQKFTSPWFLIVLLPEWSTTVFFFVIVVHESLVCPEQLNVLLFFRKILNFPQILWFSCIVVYLKPFQQWLYASEIHLFTPRTTEGLICNYYRRFKRSLMLQKEKNMIFFSFSTALQRLHKIVTCFREDKISSIYPDLQIQKVFIYSALFWIWKKCLSDLVLSRIYGTLLNLPICLKN